MRRIETRFKNTPSYTQHQHRKLLSREKREKKYERKFLHLQYFCMVHKHVVSLRRNDIFIFVCVLFFFVGSNKSHDTLSCVEDLIYSFHPSLFRVTEREREESLLDTNGNSIHRKEIVPL